MEARRDVFQAIADPIRRDIIELLADDPKSVNEIANQFEISRPAISKHLRVLEECGIVEFQRQGRTRYCRIRPSQLIPAFMWIDQYRKLWEDRIDSFEDYLMELQNKKKK